jgi:hypothetical protein
MTGQGNRILAESYELKKAKANFIVPDLPGSGIGWNEEAVNGLYA